MGEKAAAGAKPDLAATWQTQLDAARPGGRNEREKDTRSAIRFLAPDAALGAGGRRSAAIPTGQNQARKELLRASLTAPFVTPADPTPLSEFGLNAFLTGPLFFLGPQGFFVALQGLLVTR